MNYGWNERAYRAEAKTFIGGDNPAAVYEVGKYSITISGVTPEQQPEVTYRNQHYRSSDPRQTFPNMEVVDGEIRLPVSDLVSDILAKLDPVELAQALWTNDEVRSAFTDCLVTRYNEQGVDDLDRRKFLAAVKEAVHDKALDEAASTVAKLEYTASRRYFFYHDINSVNDRQGALEQMLRSRFGVDDIVLPRLRHEDSDRDFSIGGKNWNEARDFWRAEMPKLFLAPGEGDT